MEQGCMREVPMVKGSCMGTNLLRALGSIPSSYWGASVALTRRKLKAALVACMCLDPDGLLREFLLTTVPRMYCRNKDVYEEC